MECHSLKCKQKQKYSKLIVAGKWCSKATHHPGTLYLDATRWVHPYFLRLENSVRPPLARILACLTQFSRMM